MSERLYYKDSYLRRWQATVRNVEGSVVYLDQTAFYPTSGGQPHDLGSIGGYPVIDIVDEGDRIAHRLAPGQAESYELTGLVSCEVDWARRYDHMQQHTGQHLLSSVFEDLLRMRTLSFHMSPFVSTVELDTSQVTSSQIQEVESRVHALIWEAVPVAISFAEAGEVTALRKQSERSGELRIISIGSFDRSACGGTHVRSTAELAPVQIRRLEKVRGHVRLEFVCGGRAVARHRQDFQLLTDLSQRLGEPFEELPASVERMNVRCARAEKESERLTRSLATFEGHALHEQTVPRSDGVRRILIDAPAPDETLRAKAQACAERGQAIVMVVVNDPRTVLIAASPDSGIHAGAILKSVLASAGARGGGSPVLAQGTIPSDAALANLKQALGF